MAVSAEMLNKKHLLRKGLTGLKFAVQRQKLVCSDVQSKVKGRLLARYWLKVGDIFLEQFSVHKHKSKKPICNQIFRSNRGTSTK